MKMVTGVIEPSGGVVPFDGKPILDDLMTFRQRVGYVPEEPHLYTHLSGMEYLVMIRDRALPWLPKKSYNSQTRPKNRTTVGIATTISAVLHDGSAWLCTAQSAHASAANRRESLSACRHDNWVYYRARKRVIYPQHLPRCSN